MNDPETEVIREVTAEADATPSNDFVIMLGERPQKSAPTLTLAKALAALGVTTRFANAQLMTRREWLDILSRARGIVLVTYGAVDVYLLSQLAIAVALDVPVVRWWVGTDVLTAMTQPELRADVQRVDSIVSENIAVAPHLVDELASIGIGARFVPSVLDPGIVPRSMISWGNELRPVLIYLPGSRKEFYRIDVLEPVIASSPDIRFIIVADDTHALAKYPNVESLGWVSDMRELYTRAGCVLRITEHDGLPRMLMEALLSGMYAIYSWPLDGSWLARTADEALSGLARYREMNEPNVHGREAMLEMMRSRPDQIMSSVISDASVPFPRRARALGLAVRTKVFPAQFR
ncbi:MAG: hypothetical protein ABI889_03750 [Gemmatimonadota bacterium]